jgi:phosphopantothenoylcysteine decarboxylase/phosphopantothenate--cysteine ligase
VRVITNRSSGKQGYAVAADAARRGAKVTLVSTITGSVPAGVDVIPVDTAAEMAEAVFGRADQADVVVMAAAVADFRPVAPAAGKLKKDAGPPRIELEPTVDILAELGSRKRPGQVLVGFAAETANVAEHAADKLRRKHLDLIVANDVSAPGVGFEHDTNAVTIIGRDGMVQNVPLADKRQVAAAVLDAVVAASVRGPAQAPSHPAQEQT